MGYDRFVCVESVHARRVLTPTPTPTPTLNSNPDPNPNP